MTDQFIHTKTAARILGVSVKALYNAHSRGASWAPPRVKIGRMVRYRLADVLACVKPG